MLVFISGIGSSANGFARLMGEDFLIISSGVGGTMSGAFRPGENTETGLRDGEPGIGLSNGLRVDRSGSLSSAEEILAASGENSGGGAGDSFFGVGRIAARGSGVPLFGVM